MNTETKKGAKIAKSGKKVQSPIRVGNNVLIRGVTLYYTGKIVGFSKEEILLIDAAWIADTSRFSSALLTGELSEVEPYPDGDVVAINRGAVSDTSDWKHPLPRSVK